MPVMRGHPVIRDTFLEPCPFLRRMDTCHVCILRCHLKTGITEIIDIIKNDFINISFKKYVMYTMPTFSILMTIVLS